jgi:hypothetical protein
MTIGMAGQKNFRSPETAEVTPQMAIMMTAPPAQSRHSLDTFSACSSRATTAAEGLGTGRSLVSGSSSASVVAP